MNKKEFGIPLLIVGCQRSGTTLLASMLSRHPEIGMLNECEQNSERFMLGFKYNGNKLCAWTQIRMDTRASRIGYLVNRIVHAQFLPSKFMTSATQRARLFPTSKKSVQDYLREDAVVLVITRDKRKVVDSMVRRGGYKLKGAHKEYDRALDILNQLISDGHFHVSYEALVQNPEKVMQQVCQHLQVVYTPEMLDGCKYNTFYPEKSIVAGRA